MSNFSFDRVSEATTIRWICQGNHSACCCCCASIHFERSSANPLPSIWQSVCTRKSSPNHGCTISVYCGVAWS